MRAACSVGVESDEVVVEIEWIVFCWPGRFGFSRNLCERELGALLVAGAEAVVGLQSLGLPYPYSVASLP